LKRREREREKLKRGKTTRELKRPSINEKNEDFENNFYVA